jgi:hypothetical protein
MWPGSRLSYFEILREPNFEDYEIEYWSGNRWGFLGSGFVDFEFNGSRDMTWYLDTFSDNQDWVKGVPFNQDPEEFASISSGGLPRETPKTPKN